MKKKIVLGIIILFLILLFPIRDVYQDGGSVEYKAIIYKIINWHKLNSDSKTGYFTGTTIEIMGIGVFDNTNEHKKEEEKQFEVNDSTLNYYLLSEVEGKEIYTNYNEIKYNDNNLTESITNNSFYLSNFIEKLNKIDEYNDGGSILYDGTDINNNKYYVGVCNTLMGDKDIYIGDNESLIENCNVNIKVDNNCLNNILGGYIANNNDSKEIDTKKITALNVDYNNNVIFGNKYMYSIVKSDNSKVIDEFNNYFKNKYSKYYFENFANNYYVFLYNGIESVDPTTDILSCFK